MYSRQDLALDITNFTDPQLEEFGEHLRKQRDTLRAQLTTDLYKTNKATYDQIEAERDEIYAKLDEIGVIAARNSFKELTPKEQDNQLRELFANPDKPALPDYEQVTTDSFYAVYLKKLGLFPVKQAQEQKDNGASLTTLKSRTMGNGS